MNAIAEGQSMGEPVSLRYHTAMFQLLEEEPRLCSQSVELIELCEARSGIRLPEALREWYSLEGAEHLVDQPLYKAGLHSLQTLLQRFPRFVAETHDPPFLFPIYDVGSSGWRAGLLLEGYPDPQVLENSSEREPLGLFSEFVYDCAWRSLIGERAFGVELEREHGIFGPAQLDLLRESLHELRPEPPRGLRHPRTGERFEQVWLYCFYDKSRRIRVTAIVDAGKEEGQAWWEISSNTAEGLYELLKRLWPFLGSPGQLANWADRDNAAVAEVLRRLGEEFGTTITEPSE
jgi:hypothetical protein